MQSANNDPNGAGDMHEGFDVGWEDLSSRASRADDGAMTGENVWPNENKVPGFRGAVMEY